VSSLRELPSSKLVLCDVTPKQLVALAGDLLPRRYRRRLERWRYGPGAFKLDYALDGPIPWRASEVAEAGTVHVGGSLSEIAESERAAWEGRHAERPFVLLAQQSLFDETRAPTGKHTAWAYCHVPNGSTFDMRERVEAQIERFAPGFRDRILACASRNTADLERDNANLVGGDIAGGANTLGQLLARPSPRLIPYSTPLSWLYICSSSTPPGAGVHGMCGHLAAKAALRPRFSRS
jgi:phytoene dehydrogenase-like protein